MSAVNELIAECTRRDIHLEAAGDRLRWQGPTGAMTPDLADRLKQHKPELLRGLIQAEPPTLTETEEVAIRDYLDRIGETDPEARGECLAQCRQDQAARDYFLSRAREVPTPQQQAALDKLAESPELKYAFMVNDPDADPVRVSIAIRNVGAVDLLVPHGKWDPWLFLETLNRQREAN